jgi:hypothetical protein
MANELDEVTGSTNPKGNGSQISNKPNIYKKSKQIFFEPNTSGRKINFQAGSEGHK